LVPADLKTFNTLVASPPCTLPGSGPADGVLLWVLVAGGRIELPTYGL
jgi:hypothetical protein